MGNANDTLSGAQVSVHPRHMLGIFEHYGTWPLLTVVGYAAACVVGYFLVQNYSHAKAVALVALVTAPTIILIVLVRLAGRGLSEVIVREDGLEWAVGEGRFSRSWDHIQNIVNNAVFLTGNQNVALSVEFRDGAVMEATMMLLGYKKLCRNVQRLAGNSLLRDKATELERGGVQFGPLTLHTTGYEAPQWATGGARMMHKWEELRDWRIVNGRFVVLSTAGGFATDVSHENVPNFFLFLVLVEHLWKPPLSTTKYGWNQ